MSLEDTTECLVMHEATRAKLADAIRVAVQGAEEDLYMDFYFTDVRINRETMELYIRYTRLEDYLK